MKKNNHLFVLILLSIILVSPNSFAQKNPVKPMAKLVTLNQISFSSTKIFLVRLKLLPCTQDIWFSHLQN
jgi:hypothetical protein